MNTDEYYLPWIIFDYDDTLGGLEMDGKIVPNGQAYTKAIEDFTSFMKDIGLPKDQALTKFRQVDTASLDEQGFGQRDRFALSMIETYEELSRFRGGAHPSISDELYKIGMSVFDHPYVPLPGALDTLKALRSKYRIAVATKGAPDEQVKKLRDSGVMDLIDDYQVMSHKDHADWEIFVSSREFTPEKTWAVGNSPASDIKIPMEMGMHGILLTGTYTWEYESADRPDFLRKGQQYHEVPTVQDILAIIPH